MAPRFSREVLETARSLEDAEENQATRIEEVTRTSQPDHIDADTWALIQDTGRLACERLYAILSDPKFLRLRAGDQAKLIALAQTRAYGVAVAKKEARRGRIIDVTAEELRDTATRAALPEYRKIDTPN
jgi:hypothetical protein